MNENTTNKIARIKENILDNHKLSLKQKIDDVLSICDSEIEKLMILQLYNYFQKQDVTKYNRGRYSEIEFILHQFIKDEPDKEAFTKVHELYLKNVYKHSYEFPYYSKYIGFSTTKIFSESFSLDSDVIIYYDDLITHQIEVRPQEFGHIIGGYRVDIAIFLNRIQYNKVIETRKLAIECDGKDYHSTNEQIAYDKQRDNELIENGWKDVIRFSGSKIYRIDDNLEKIHFEFETILDKLLS